MQTGFQLARSLRETCTGREETNSAHSVFVCMYIRSGFCYRLVLMTPSLNLVTTAASRPPLPQFCLSAPEASDAPPTMSDGQAGGRASEREQKHPPHAEHGKLHLVPNIELFVAVAPFLRIP